MEPSERLPPLKGAENYQIGDGECLQVDVYRGTQGANEKTIIFIDDRDNSSLWDITSEIMEELQPLSFTVIFIRPKVELEHLDTINQFNTRLDSLIDFIIQQMKSVAVGDTTTRHPSLYSLNDLNDILYIVCDGLSKRSEGGIQQIYEESGFFRIKSKLVELDFQGMLVLCSDDRNIQESFNGPRISKFDLEDFNLAVTGELLDP